MRVDALKNSQYWETFVLHVITISAQRIKTEKRLKLLFWVLINGKKAVEGVFETEDKSWTTILAPDWQIISVIYLTFSWRLLTTNRRFFESGRFLPRSYVIFAPKLGHFHPKGFGSLQLPLKLTLIVLCKNYHFWLHANDTSMVVFLSR